MRLGISRREGACGEGEEKHSKDKGVTKGESKKGRVHHHSRDNTLAHSYLATRWMESISEYSYTCGNVYV